MTAVHSMTSFYEKLKQRGLSRSFVQGVLPEWWNDSIANTAPGYQEAGMLLAKLFNFRPSSLLSADSQPEYRLGLRKFKRQQKTEIAELDIACSLAMTAAKIAISAIPSDYLRPNQALELRRAILNDPEQRWIDFSTLLEYCWQLGIPVLHLSHLPAGAKKMDGLAISVGGRPAIVLTSKRQHGFLLFHLAHELGHVAEGHVDEDGSWAIDTEIDGAGDQDDEIAANQYGFLVLTGEPTFKGLPACPTGHLAGRKLALEALSLGSSRRIDPMHIALVTAYRHQKNFVAGGSAVKELAKNRPSDIDVCTTTLERQLDWSCLTDDESSLLRKLTGM